MTNAEDQIQSYVVGHTEPETGRLLIQAHLYDPYTEAALRKAGIRAGMQILDVGSGIGNLSLLAAKLVGTSGQIVGIDADARVSQVAIQRAADLGVENVEFLVGDILSFDFKRDFDAIIGRLILLHIKEPAALLKRLVSYLRPGGIVAFEEIASVGTAIPACSHIESVNEIFIRYFENLEIDLEFGYKLPQIFQAAGLDVPALDYFAPAGAGPDWLGYRWLAEGIKAHMPVLQYFAIASDPVHNIDTLETRIREEAVTNQSVVTILPHIAAWTTVS